MKIKLNNVKRVPISTDYIKLDSLLKFTAIASTGGEAKTMIMEGDVFVDGEPCTMRGKKIIPGNVVRFGNTMFLVAKHK